MPFLLYKLIGQCLMPLPLFLAAAAVLLAAPPARLFALLPLLLLALLSTPKVGRALYRRVCGEGLAENSSFFAVEADPPAADVLVVLSGGFPDRDLRGLTLFHRRVAPVLLFSGHASAATMRRRRELLELAGVPPQRVLFESGSRSTGEGGRAFAILAEQQHWRSALLVTDSYHMPRALGRYRVAGVRVTAAPCPDPHLFSAEALRSRPAHQKVLDLVPCVDGLASSTLAWRELLGRGLRPR